MEGANQLLFEQLRPGVQSGTRGRRSMLVACRKLAAAAAAAIFGDFSFSAWVRMLQEASIPWIDNAQKQEQVRGRHRKLVQGSGGRNVQELAGDAVNCCKYSQSLERLRQWAVDLLESRPLQTKG